MNNYEQIANKFGTPLYIFDIKTLIERVAYLKSYLKDIDLVYAVKANTFIIREIEAYVERFEICSPGEYQICKKLNVDSKKMVISGVYKDYDSISKMVSTDNILKYTVESVNQWRLLNELTKKYQKKINVLLRLTSGNQFGINEDELKILIQNNDNPLIEIDGIEYFSGTQKHSLKRIEKEIDMLNALISDIKENLNFDIKELEYGAGLPVYYFQDDEFNEDEFLKEFSTIIAKVKNVKVSIELGRSIAASCGSYITKVVDLKSNKNGNFALVDGGIHHLVYYGGTMAMRTPFFEVYPKRNNEIMNYNLYGSLCTINDILIKNINIPKLELNDIFVFKKTGAYSATEGIALFLSRELPKVAIQLPNNEVKLVRNIFATSELNLPNYEGEEV